MLFGLDMVRFYFKNIGIGLFECFGFFWCFFFGLDRFFCILGVQTAALEMLTSKESSKYARKPTIMADAAYAILVQDPKQPNSSGNFYIDDEVLKNEGITDFAQYCVDPNYKDQLIIDFFVSKL